MPALQTIALPAASAAGPLTATALEMSAAEYCIVHWRATGWVPPLLNTRSRVTLLPGVPAPDPRLKVADWAFANDVRANMLKITARTFSS